MPLKPEGIETPKGRERFFQNEDAPAFLQGLGFNVFSLANNHAFDWGEAGFLKVKAALGNGAFGAGTYEEAYRPKIVETGGLKFGFLAASFAAYTGVFDDVTRRDGLGCAYVYDYQFSHAIADTRKQVDYLFVLPHDGIEYIDIPMPEVRARYRDFIDWGADAVVASHPHCPQGCEMYKGKPIFYSLGNFLFNSKEGYDYRATNRPHWYEGLCVVVTIEDGAASYEVVNTRNTDNLALSVDHDPSREEHNARLNALLADRDLYTNRLKDVCNKLGTKELAIVDQTDFPVLKRLWFLLRGKAMRNNYRLQRLMVHDARRALLLWTIKLKKID